MEASCAGTSCATGYGVTARFMAGAAPSDECRQPEAGDIGRRAQVDDQIGAGLIARGAVDVDHQDGVADIVAGAGGEQNRLVRAERADRRGEVAVEMRAGVQRTGVDSRRNARDTEPQIDLVGARIEIEDGVGAGPRRSEALRWVKVSAPGPPYKRSAPPLPVMISLPLPPVSESAPAPPSITKDPSFSFTPSKVSLLAEVSAVPSTVSVAPAARLASAGVSE